MRRKYGSDIYTKIGARGGRNSSSRPMKDATYASLVAKIGWVKRKYKAGDLTDKQYEEQLGLAQRKLARYLKKNIKNA
jgi:hypothetical protein